MPFWKNAIRISGSFPNFLKWFIISCQGMLKASYQKYLLHFKEPSGTSRGVLTDKETYFIRIWDELRPEVVGQ